MELRAIWKVIRRRWWLIALPALAALIYAGYGYLKSPPVGGYATSIRFTAAQPPDSGSQAIQSPTYYAWLTSEYVVNALTDWVKTNSFAEAVSEELGKNGVNIPAAQLQGAMSPDNARSIMVINISWPDAGQLSSIAGAVKVVLETRSGEFFPPFKDTGVAVIALDTPVIGAVPPSLTARLNPLLRFGLGLVAGIALAALVEYLDPTLHERAEVEKMGLPVLAEIPGGRK